jgi:metal-responsive CopG/Arc/MetJ family transcriptional regulator
MATAKIAITIDRRLLKEIDRLVKQRKFANRSRAVQEALWDKLQRLKRTRLARECAKLDPKEEQEMAEEWFVGERELWAEGY